MLPIKRTTMKNYLSIVLLFFANFSFAQMTNGLVAEWRMNGNAGDSSGNGNHGTIKNVTFTAGKSGLPNTAARFLGNDSCFIRVADASDFNISKYSICALLKVDAFYDGLCQGNFVLIRGIPQTKGFYGLEFNDNNYDGDDCNNRDTTKHIFVSSVGQGYLNSPAWRYSPTIALNTWYAVVATYDGSKIKIFVDGIQKSTMNYGGGIGSGLGDIIIGRNHLATTQSPYWFEGLIDNIRLYDRVLADSEIVEYGKIALDTPTTSVPALAHNIDFKVYPNPSDGDFRLIGNTSYSGDVKVELFNVTGNLTYKAVITPKDGNFTSRIKLEQVPAGIYLMKISAGERYETIKVVFEERRG